MHGRRLYGCTDDSPTIAIDVEVLLCQDIVDAGVGDTLVGVLVLPGAGECRKTVDSIANDRAGDVLQQQDDCVD